MISPRLRMFAGPNGSGKSTIKAKVAQFNPNIFGVYINPDEIKRVIDATGKINFGDFKIRTNKDQILSSLYDSRLLKEKGLLDEVSKLTFDKNSLSFREVSLFPYFVSPLADFLHEKLITSLTSFSFETVMSHTHKIELLNNSHAAGFRNYLYYVATEDPEINISRVQIRVREGGHDVPKDKIVTRYHRSLGNLLDAIRATERAYVFDNSGAESALVAEITNGKDIEITNSNVPVWFKKYVLDKGT